MNLSQIQIGLSRVGGSGSVLSNAIDAARRNGGVLYTVPDNYMTLGPELAPPVSNSWTFNTGVANSGGDIAFSGAAASYLAFVDGGTWVAGKQYVISIDYSSTATLSFYLNGVSHGGPAAGSGAWRMQVQVSTAGVAGRLQFNASNTATGYIRNISVREILTDSLYQDSTGVTPVSTVGQLVGLMLDSTATVGAEIVADTGFDVPAYWTCDTGVVVSSSAAVFNGTGSATAAVYRSSGLTAGKTYQVTYTVSGYVSGSHLPLVGSGTLVSARTGNGTFTAIAVADSTPLGVRAGSGVMNITDVSYKQITGTHAAQATTANKPTLGRGLYNLLTWSNDLTNAAWSKAGSPTVTGGQSDHSGGSTAFQFSRTTIGASYLAQSFSKAAAALQYTVAVVMKAGSSRYGSIRAQGYYPSRVDAIFDLQGGLVTSFSASGSFSAALSSIVSLGNGYYLCVVSATTDTNGGVSVHVSFNSTVQQIDGSDVISSGTGYCSGIGMFTGTLTAQQILANGGIPVTTSSAGWNQTAGRYVLSFDGSNDTLTFTPQAITAAATLVWAGNLKNVASTPVLMGQSAGGVQLYINSAGGVQAGQAAGVNFGSANGLVQNDVPFVVSVQIAVNGTSIIRLNGVQVSASTALVTALTGVQMNLMSNGSSNHAAGTTGFDLCSNTILSLADLQAAERAAAQSVGVTLP